jgi:hypothetical protein
MHEKRISSIPDRDLRGIPGAPAIGHKAEAKSPFVCEEREPEKGLHKKKRVFEEIGKDGCGVAFSPDDSDARTL